VASTVLHSNMRVKTKKGKWDEERERARNRECAHNSQLLPSIAASALRWLLPASAPANRENLARPRTACVHRSEMGGGGGGGGRRSVRSSRHISSVGVIDCTAKRYEFHREAHPAVANRQDVITHLYSSSQLPLRVCSAGGSPERNHAINSSGLNVPRFGTL
jgi:hypothetical protein